jgi:hypothetical protein
VKEGGKDERKIGRDTGNDNARLSSEQKLSPSTHAFIVRPTTVEEIQLGGRLRKRIG